MPYADREVNRVYQKEWQRKRRLQRAEYGRMLRKRVLAFLGGKCVYCGCDISEALEINHKNGGGHKRKKWQTRRAFYFAILNGKQNKDELELTCRVCNAWHCLTRLRGIEDHWDIKWLPDNVVG